MSEEEAGLVMRLRAGDSSAFSELLAVHSGRVLNTCYRFLLNRQDAEDLSQEVFVEVFQSIHTFRGNSRLSTWIYRIAVTKCLDELKRRKRKKRLSSVSRMLHLDELAEHPAGGPMPDSDLHHAESLQLVARALDRLPDSQRVAFTLSKMEGYSNAEIAEIMKTTKVAVESLISRAKGRVSAELEGILKKI